LKATEAKAYSSGKTKAVTLPSTLPNGSHPVFIIRKMPPRTAIKLLSVLKINIEVDLEAADRPEKALRKAIKNLDAQKLLEVVNTVIPDCVVEPKVVLGKAKRAGELSIDDIELDDLFHLFDEIWEWSGLTEKAAKERAKFR